MARKTTSRTTSKPRTARRSASPAARGNPSLLLLGVGAAAFAGTVALLGIFARRREWLIGDAEHAAPDLALDQPRPGSEDRAPDAFRPDPTAPVPANEREGLRPATGPAPSLMNGGRLG